MLLTICFLTSSRGYVRSLWIIGWASESLVSIYIINQSRSNEPCATRINQAPGNHGGRYRTGHNSVKYRTKYTAFFRAHKTGRHPQGSFRESQIGWIYDWHLQRLRYKDRRQRLYDVRMWSPLSRRLRTYWLVVKCKTVQRHVNWPFCMVFESERIIQELLE